MSTLLIRDARVLTLAAPGPRRASAMADLGILPRADVLIDRGAIAEVGRDLRIPHGIPHLSAGGRIVMPAFVDCHTHLCWAGGRLDEWEQRLRGVPYLDILAGGGGIMSTVRAVRAASQEELAAAVGERLDLALRAGATTVEIKSGYGLSPEHELKMLRAIREAAHAWPGAVVPTALLGHAVDEAQPGFVERTIRETLPAVHAEFPGIAIDAFCERSAWSRQDTLRLFEAARSLGHPVRLHADQFTSLGIVPDALRLGARSIDHLEATTREDAEALARSQTFAVILPVSPFHLGTPQADARRLIDAGAAVCIATNANPGSAPTFSMPLAIALAVRQCGMTPAEAITAATVNPACLLGLPDRGRIAPGQRADLLLLRHTDERMLAYELGGNPVDHILIAGQMLRV
jgi:imidazolonepropionase